MTKLMLALDFEDLTEILNNSLERLGKYRYIKDENIKILAIITNIFYIIQAKKGLKSLLDNNELSPTEIATIVDIERRTGGLRDEIKYSITPEKFQSAIQTLRECAIETKINSEIASKFNFNSQLDVGTILQQIDEYTDYDYSIHFSREIRNVTLLLRKPFFYIFYQAADEKENSIFAQSPESFCNKRDCKIAKTTLVRSYEFVEELLANSDKNQLVEMFVQELLDELDM